MTPGGAEEVAVAPEGLTTGGARLQASLTRRAPRESEVE